MYSYLFQTPMSMQATSSFPSQLSYGNDSSIELKKQQYELKAGLIGEASDQFNPQIKRAPLTIRNSNELTNEYLLNQKLRNSGLYSKLKNKTLYSKSEFVRDHTRLNSGIL